MCEHCWAEAGKPSIITKEVRDTAVLIGLVYDQPHGNTGGSLHIVVDDWNLEDGSINWCLNELECSDVEKECAQALLALSEEERYSAMALHSEFIKATTKEVV